MHITELDFNTEILKEIGRRIKETRVAIPMTQVELSEQTGLSVGTISAMENGKDCAFSSFLDVLRALNQLSNVDLLVTEQAPRPSQAAQLGKKRERATSAAKKQEKNASSWKWGDVQ